MSDQLLSQQSPETTALGTVVATSDGSLTLSHHEHGECYHTRAGALAEAHYLYVVASGFQDLLAQEAQQPVSVLDVGLGLGYTAIVTLEAWEQATSPGPLVLVSLEINGDLVPPMAAAAAPWQENWPELRKSFCRALVKLTDTTWEARLRHPRSGAAAIWQIHIGDAAVEPIPSSPFTGGYTHVWQDPFSPGKNPPMWQASWFVRLRAAVTADCQMVTYSVAVPVREALDTSNWSWKKIPATMPGKRKRHWLRAQPRALTC